MDIPEIIDTRGVSSTFEVLNGVVISTTKIVLLVKIAKKSNFQTGPLALKATYEYKMQIWDIKPNKNSAGEMSMLVTYNIPEKNIAEVIANWRNSFVIDYQKNEFYFPDYSARGQQTGLLMSKVSIINSTLGGKVISAAQTNVETLNMSITHVQDFVARHIDVGKVPKGNLLGGSLYKDFLVHQNLLYLAHGMFVSVIDLDNFSKIEHLSQVARKNFKNGGSRKSCYKQSEDVEALVMLDKEGIPVDKRWQVLVFYKSS
jgi:hypothetical protein